MGYTPHIHGASLERILTVVRDFSGEMGDFQKSKC